MNKRKRQSGIGRLAICLALSLLPLRAAASEAPRTLRYFPQGDSLVCLNGENRYTRALYGSHEMFRLETSDRPLFATYNKDRSYNLRFYLIYRGQTVRLDSTDWCRSAYRGGRRSYELHDARWGENARLFIDVLALMDGEGAVWRFTADGFDSPAPDGNPNGASPTVGSGSGSPANTGNPNGASPAAGAETPVMEVRKCRIAKIKMNRAGDLGTDPRENFDPSPDEIGLEVLRWPLLTAEPATKTPTAVAAKASAAKAAKAPAPKNSSQSYLVLEEISQLSQPEAARGKAVFDRQETLQQALASQLSFQTPDPFINTLGPTLMAAADGLWDGVTETWLHGCIGWRTPLAGWRGAYVGDVVGWDNRAEKHFRAYANSMVTQVLPVLPHPTQDSANALARSDKKWGTQMYSNGYICRLPNNDHNMTHYDMNLNYIDELLQHFSYHADTALMRELWPKLQLHLQWEKRNFDPDDDGLYDAYCCIWASDALYYNSGAVTHSSAYNYRSHLLMARIAEILGEDSAPYEREAARIRREMDRRLWLPDQGHWAEFQDFMGLKRLHPSAALWSIYTPIDCDACTSEQAYRATRYVDTSIPHIPIAFDLDTAAAATLGVDLPSLQLEQASCPGTTPFYTLSTSDWHPYVWSTNNVAHEEVANMALAYLQAGRTDEGFRLLKSDLLDEMFLGQSPGNFGQISYYDQARKEAYRDFGDNVGITSRAIVNGLFGILPDALHGRCVLQPSYPAAWDSVSVQTPYLSYRFHRENGLDIYEVEQHFAQPLEMVLRIPVGEGRFVEVFGNADTRQTLTAVCRDWRESAQADSDWREAARRRSQALADSAWLSQMGLCDVTPTVVKRRSVPMDKYFNANVDDIFRQEYLSPRSPYTTLEMPKQGMGDWCVPLLRADIEDDGFREALGRPAVALHSDKEARALRSDEFDTGLGLAFRSPRQGHNIVYTSLWDNFPTRVEIPARGEASYAYLLMAGSTNNMQSRMVNGRVTAIYADGSSDTLELVNPINWCPIEQDYFYDSYAFESAPLHPYRVHLGSGRVSRSLKADLQTASKDGSNGVHTSDLTTADTPIAQGMGIPQGAGQLLKMPLSPGKKLKHFCLETLSNDVVIGLMAITLE